MSKIDQKMKQQKAFQKLGLIRGLGFGLPFGQVPKGQMLVVILGPTSIKINAKVDAKIDGEKILKNTANKDQKL